MSKKALLCFLIFGTFVFKSFSQAPEKPTSAEIYDDLLRLNVLGSVLYVAAHPDDENTSLISYFSNHKRYHTTYLSLTRGDGGQNLIGSEIGPLLGVIRTQELLAARRLDGGHQWFSRANDFGYSKSAKETLEIWNEEEVKADAIWAIRNLQPDIIINRFYHDSSRRTHGHHTASAMISYDVFDKAGNANFYPEQLKYVDTWRPHRLFFNSYRSFYGSKEDFEKVDKSDMVALNTGVFYPLKGKSNNEISAESRSMHQCQGMGRTGTRGDRQEYLQLLKGDLPKNSEDPMIGINTTWSRVKSGEGIGKKVAGIIKGFNFEKPDESIPALLEVYNMIEKLPEGKWKKIKKAECLELIKACSGLFAEAIADSPTITPGKTLKVEVEVIQRIGSPFTFKGLQLIELDSTIGDQTLLNVNQGLDLEFDFKVPLDYTISTPYWLENSATPGMYDVPEQTLRGIPENSAKFNVQYLFEKDGIDFTLESPLVFKKNDHVTGENYSPFSITPPFSVAIQEKVVVFSDSDPKMLNVKVKCYGEIKSGMLKFEKLNGWNIVPEFQEVNFSQIGEEQRFSFELYPPKEQRTDFIEAYIEFEGGKNNQEVVIIDYDHIPEQVVLQNARAKAVKIDLKKVGDEIGYIMGAGDEVPANLEQIGYQVSLLDPNNISSKSLGKYDAVILGVRAFNTQQALKYSRDALMEYVKNGGNLIVQFNTSHRLVTKNIAPYSLKLSRDRVSVEEAEVRLIAPEHDVLNIPNKISQKDFEGWVQERGLYFADEWDEAFTPILSSNDPGESPKDGGLMIAPYGRGNFVYTGYAWFRQLPAGVPGAYRLFANIISLGKEIRP